MKATSLCFVLICLAARGLSAQTADEWVIQGRSSLTNHDLGLANACFSNAVAAAPFHQEANALYAATRLALVSQRPAVQAFLDRLGVPSTGRDVFNWTAELPRDPNNTNEVILPEDLTSDEGISLVRAELAPVVAEVQGYLSRVTDTAGVLSLSAEEAGVDNVTVDYGDIQICRAWLYGVDFAIHILQAHNLSVWVQHLQAEAQDKSLTIEKVLTDYPNLLANADNSQRAAARPAITNAIACYQAGSLFVRTDPCPQQPAGGRRAAFHPAS